MTTSTLPTLSALVPAQRRGALMVMPSRSEVRQAMLDLAAGSVSAADVSVWATAPLVANHSRPVDDVVWRGLARLVGAARPGRPAPSAALVEDWVAEFDRQASERPLS